MKINSLQLKQLIEASLFAVGKPQTISQLKDTVLKEFDVSRTKVKQTIEELMSDYQEHGIQLVKVSGGYRFQTAEFLSPLLKTLWQEKAPKYSRATLETLAVIAYQQPVTRGDIELVRGVAVSSHIMKTLLDRDWIKVIGHKEVPGRPSLYVTTKTFLAYFRANSLTDLPPLSDPETLNALFASKATLPETIKESTNE